MKGAVWVIAIVAVIFLAVLVNPKQDAAPRPPTDTQMRVDTMTRCKAAVRDQLVSPGSMRDRSTSRPYELESGAWRYVMDVDSQNVFGALLRTRWRCDVTGSSVDLTSLQ